MNELEAAQVAQTAIPTGVVAFVFIAVVVTVVRGLLQRRRISSLRSYVWGAAIFAAGGTALLLAVLTGLNVAPEFLLVIAVLSGLTAAVAAVLTK